jgi:hypothetical protein
MLTYTTSSNVRFAGLDAASGSAITRLNSIENKTGSYATTGSNTFVGGQYFSSSFNPTGFTTTASLYTDGGLRVTRDAYISGTLYLNNVTVFGTQSVAYISSSQLNIGTNIISVNTDTPSVRFGGLAVYDSGSTGLTGSMLWDSEDNQWIYSNPSGSTYDSAVFLVGPRNVGVLGNEPGISCNFLSKGNGMHHMTSSGIFEDGSRTCFYNSGFITSAGVSCFTTSCAASIIGGTVSGTTGTFSSAVTACNFVTSGNTLFGITLKGRPADNFGAIGFYSSDGGTRYGYIQSHSTNCGQLIVNGDGGGQAIFDCRGVVLTSALTGTTSCFSGNITTAGCIGIGTNSAATPLHIATTGLPAIRLTLGSEARCHNINGVNLGRDLQVLPFRHFSVQAGNGITEGQIVLNAYEDFIVGTGASYTPRLTISCTGAATFSSSLTIGNTFNINTEAWIQFLGNNVLLADGDFTILQTSGTGLMRFRNNSAQNLLTLANNGAATFTCNVIAGNVFASYSGTNAGVEFGNSGSGGQFGFLKWDNGSNYLYLGHSYGSAFNRNLVINSSGNVGIGTATIPSDRILQIHSSCAYARMALTNTSTGVAGGDGLIFQMENCVAIIKNQETSCLILGANGRETDIVINQNGGVGIGQSPINKFTILAGNTNVLDLFDTGAGFGIGMQAMNSAATVYRSWDFYASKYQFFSGQAIFSCTVCAPTFRASNRLISNFTQIYNSDFTVSAGTSRSVVICGGILTTGDFHLMMYGNAGTGMGSIRFSTYGYFANSNLLGFCEHLRSTFGSAAISSVSNNGTSISFTIANCSVSNVISGNWRMISTVGDDANQCLNVFIL